MELKYSTDEHEDEVGFWELRRGPETLAMLERICLDENWWDCFFFPEPAFEPFRHLFTPRADRGEPERGLHRAISDAAMTPSLQVEHHWRRASERGRWTEEGRSP